LEPILNISRPSCPNSQNRRFGSHFEPFLRQAAQVAKMNDLGAILSHFCAKLPKLPKWMISGPWVQYMYRDWHPQRGASVQRVLCTSKRAGFTVKRALCTSRGEGLTVQKASPFPWDPPKFGTKSLKFKIRNNWSQSGSEPLGGAGFFDLSQIWDPFYV